ncbi:PREDICTED: transport and Golgi organization protein 6 homolog isoform X1 [Polistes canadensis]|uniref:transport and Golgi organization protein 6 homolog isoform X1 n=1 Tax=Polistes canadensis TaxID=91411 RepID=UPI000719005C|nr:PREDICTED: transport and Golgi organization protein 6 homolog isoform X1 [Polistes canadensis]
MEKSDQLKYMQLLYTLTTNKTEVNDFENKLEEIVNESLGHLSEDDKYTIFGEIKCPNNNSDIRYQYIQIITYVLKKVQIIEETNDYINVNEYKLFKTAIELIVSIGIIQCLLPGIGVDMKKLCPRALKLSEEKTTILQKYERLCLSSHSLIEYYNQGFLRPAVLSHIGSLIAALLQLSYAPLKKPNKEELQLKQEKEMNEKKFVMTVDLYKKLQYDKKQFLFELERLFDSCPEYLIMKELMVILGNKEAPLWIRKKTRQHLIHKIQQPNGVLSLINTLCDDTMLDLGTDWKKLDVISRLIATPHETDQNKYYEAICPQLLNFLTLKNLNNYWIIANNCIVALYESCPNTCKKNIIDIIMRPLLITNVDHKVPESELNTCIENLLTCFTSSETQFKTLPIKLMSIITIPLFSIHNKIKSSACLLRNKVRQLLLKLLYESDLQNDLFSAFLGYNTKENFGKYISVKFGSNGGVEIIGLEKNLAYEQLADSLFDLISLDEVLITNLFSYLLKLLSNSSKLISDNVLETSYDVMERVEKQLVTIKLLSNLTTKSVVQKAQLKNPEPLLNFIKSLFDEKIIQKQNNSESDDHEVIYISLMLIKMIINSEDKTLNRTHFESFAKYLNERINDSTMPSQLVALIKDIIRIIECKEEFNQTYYDDLSVDNKRFNKFEEAIKNLSDPLLPVRAHGIITLTKLIEMKDPIAVTRKTIILRLFQENLKHEDSFIYLAAINGMCALAVMYPKEIIVILVEEYICMPQRIAICDISVQSRIKLGEILVRTTRELGKIAYVYKNILVNGFLCGARDPDPLIRASSLSCLGEVCKVLGFHLGNVMTEIIFCIICIIKTDKTPECRRAAVLVITLLLRGLEKDALTKLGRDLCELHRVLIHLRDNDKDPVLRLHAQLALEEINDIVTNYIFGKSIFDNKVFSPLV